MDKRVTGDLGCSKPKRRRRIATPPPDLNNANKDVDVYDQIVTETFIEIKSGRLNVEIDPSSAFASRASSVDSEELVDLDVMPTAECPGSPLTSGANKSLSPSELSEPSSPKSPPPPSRSANHSHRLGKGVKAAFDKLQKCQLLELEDEYIMKDNGGQSCGGTLPYDLKVRLRLPSGLQKFPLKRSDKLLSLRDQVARLESASASQVFLFYNDDSVTEEDTVNSLGLTAADIIDVSVKAHPPSKDNDVSNTITIKVQGRGGQRDVAMVDIEPDQSMGVLMKKFAEVKGLKLSDISFSFDGEDISSTDTPSSLDIEDGDCIDYLCL